MLLVTAHTATTAPSFSRRPHFYLCRADTDNSQNSDTESADNSTAMVKTRSTDVLTSLGETLNTTEDDAGSRTAPDSLRPRRYSTGSYATPVAAPKFEPTIPAIQDAQSETSSASGQLEKQDPGTGAETGNRKEESASAPTQLAPKQHRAWLRAVPNNILVPSVKVDAGQFEKIKPPLSAFAPPFQQRAVVVDSNGDLRPTDTIPEDPESTAPRETEASKSAWSRGSRPSLKSLTLKKISNSNLSSGKLAPPPSAVSIFGTESDPATPWDPALRQQQINAMRQTAWDPALPLPPRTSHEWPSVAQASERKKGDETVQSPRDSAAPESKQVHPEYAGSLFVPPTPLATPLHPPMVPPYYHGPYVEPTQGAWPYPQNAAANASPPGDVQGVAWYPPPPVMYPWGMPMSPILPPQPVQESQAKPKGQAKDRGRGRNHRRGMSTPADLLKLPGGLGVMWTPAGWAVQDAAMKLDLRLAEMKLAGETVEASGKEKKSYYKSERAVWMQANGQVDSVSSFHRGIARTAIPVPSKSFSRALKFTDAVTVATTHPPVLLPPRTPRPNS